MSNALTERARALEDLYFQALEQKRLDAIAARKLAERNAEELAAELGLHDSELLGQLVALGLTAERAAVLTLVPLLMVAWADRCLEPAERNAIEVEALAAGITADSAAHELLGGLMSEAPAPALIDAWRLTTRAALAGLDAGARESFATLTLDRARHVARAAGSILGFGGISVQEQAVLDDIEAVLSGA